MHNPLAYIASPLGFSEAGRLFYNNVLLSMIKEIGFEVRDPWVLTPQETNDFAAKLSYGQEKRKDGARLI